MRLNVSHKMAKKSLAVRRKNWQILTFSRKKSNLKKISVYNKWKEINKIRKISTVNRKGRHPIGNLNKTKPCVFVLLNAVLKIIMIIITLSCLSE